MPISAVPVWNDTSRKTGTPVGNAPATPTREVTPLTEIVTVGAGSGAGVVLVGVVLEPPAGGTALTGVVVVVVVAMVVGLVDVG